jgi:hypothetical protein
MRPTDMEPTQTELEELLDEEERTVLEDPRVPEEEKVEIDERLERVHEEDLEVELGDETGKAP